MARKQERPVLRIELTPEQQEQVRQAIGKEVTVLELTPEELEERVAPMCDGSVRF
jgi:hypothetical protein